MFKKRILSIIILIGLFFSLSWYVSSHYKEFLDIKNITLDSILLLSILFVFGVIARSIFLKLLMRAYVKKLKFKESVAISIFTTLGDYVLPFAGFSARAVYFKKLHSFSYSHYLSSLMATYVIYLITSSIIGLVSSVVLYLKSCFFNLPVIIFLMTVLLICILIIYFDFRLLIHKPKNVFFKTILNIIDGWMVLKSKKVLQLKLAFLIMVRLVILGLIIYYSFFAFGYHIGLPEAFFISSMTAFSMMLRITPSSLGLQEGAIVFSSGLFGFTLAQSLLIAGLIRVLNIIVLVVMAVVYFLFNWMFFRNRE